MVFARGINLALRYSLNDQETDATFYGRLHLTDVHGIFDE